MKGSRTHSQSQVARVLPCLLLLVVCSPAALAQQPQQQPAAAPADAEALQRRVVRARALAAAGNLPAARSELESLRASGADESLSEITLVLLMGIYFEQSDYSYAENLLNEAFRARAPRNEAATRAYYLLAGQVLSGVRSQLDRYREFGLDVADASLPEEATGHLDRLRKLVEHVVSHGRQLREESAKNIDAAALLENASSARVLLARNAAERGQWQREVADVRQRLVGSNARPPAPARTATTAQTVPPAAATQSLPQPTPAPSPTPAAAAAQNNNTRAGATTPQGQPAAPAGQSGAARAAESGPAQPTEVGSLVARATQTVAPTYPQTARTARVSGRVTVYLLVDERGAVEAVRRSEGPELLRRAAEDAARRWKFRPVVVGAQPVRASGFVQFNFTL